MRTRLVVLGLSAVLLVGACGVPTDDKPRVVDREALPGPLRPPESTPTPSTGARVTASARVYLVREGRLQGVTRAVAAPPGLPAVLDALLLGPTPEEQHRGLRSALTSDVRLDTAVNSGVALIDVTPLTVEGEEQILAVAQLVFTATAVPGIHSVSISLEGRPVEVPTGDGTLKAAPLERADFASVAPEDRN